MVIVDTSVWIDYLRGVANAETNWLNQQIDQQRLGLTDIVLCELLQGLRSESHVLQVRVQLSHFEIFTTGGEALAVTSAANYRTLRSQGVTVRKTIDCLIATFCLLNNHTLLHRDRDFDAFEQHLGLRVVQPT